MQRHADIIYVEGMRNKLRAAGISIPYYLFSDASYYFAFNTWTMKGFPLYRVHQFTVNGYYLSCESEAKERFEYYELFMRRKIITLTLIDA